MEKQENVMQTVRTYEDAFAIVKARTDLKEWMQELVSVDTPDQVPTWLRIFIVCQALNENWTPDWNNSSEYKYYPWFRMRGSFSYDDYYCGHTATHVGSRLCYKSSALAQYAGKQFTKEYESYMKF